MTGQNAIPNGDAEAALRSRDVEVMLWRAALSLVVDHAGMDESRADAALVAVARYTARPERVSESRLVGVIVDSVRGGVAEPVEELALRLVRLGGVPVDVAARALGMEGGRARSLIAGVDSRNEARGADGLAARVAAADAVGALRRLDTATAGLRRRRKWANAMKFIAYGVVLGLVVYAMYDLRRAGDAERDKKTPADLFSLPMPK